MYPRLRDLREDRDLSQKELAKVIGMSQTGYSKYETGENDIPTGILIALARFYDVSVDYLLGETNVKERYKKLGQRCSLSLFFTFRDPRSSRDIQYARCCSGKAYCKARHNSRRSWTPCSQRRSGWARFQDTACLPHSDFR